MSAPPSKSGDFATVPDVDPVGVDTLSRGTGALATALKPLVSHLNTGAWVVIDLMIALAAVQIAFLLSPYSDALRAAEGHADFLRIVLAYAPVFVIVGHVFGLHDKLIRRGKWNLLAKATLVTFLSCLVVAGIAVFVYYLKIGRHVLAFTAAFSFLGVALTRLLAWHFDQTFRHRVCLIGGEEFCRTARSVHASSSQRIEAITLCVEHSLNDGSGSGGYQLTTDPFEPAHFVLSAAEPSQGRFSLDEWTRRRGVDEIVVETPLPHGLRDSIAKCLSNGAVIGKYADHVESRFSFVPVEEIDLNWFFSKRHHPYYHIFKRASDLVLASLGLLLAMPLLLIAALAIKLESKGPVFYSQIRTGLRNRPFRIFKLRTMGEDAEAYGAQWAVKGDMRITNVGRLLRKTRLDEVPQFWNIIKGEMAFIGPRPERPEFVEELDKQLPFYSQRHLVKPGLTGWAQIHLSYGSSVEDAMEKLKYDLFYVKHCRLELDLHILFRTVGTIMKGAR